MRRQWLIGLTALAAGCGAERNGETGGDPAMATGIESVSVSGRVTFEYVPIMPGTGAKLDYNASEARPARGVTVHVIAGDRTIGSAFTDEDGRYRLDAPRDTEMYLTIRAELVGERSDALARVLDNTRDGAMYSMHGPPFTTAETDLVRDLHAASGWTGTQYGENRVAAPFAILDVAYDAMKWVRTADPDLEFVPLELYWSPDNLGIPRDDGEPDYDTGRIGGTHYRRPGSEGGRSPAIYLVGAENEDTDEYDRSVIAHEWMHYFLDTRSRDDSIGGRHALGEQQDMRVAFSEGVATAFAAAMTGESEFRYSLGPHQAYGGHFSVEHAVPRHPGWFSEDSVIAIVYDLLDPVNDDALEFGFDEIYDVLANELRETPALTSIYPLIDALKRRHPHRAAEIDALLASHGIQPIVDAYGSTESNAGYPPSTDALPVYSSLTVNGETANVCSTVAFRTAQAQGNGLGVWRFLRFTAPVGSGVTMSVTPTSAPSGERPGARTSLYRMGIVQEAQGTPSAACGPEYLPGCGKRVSAPPSERRGEYVLAVAEATNASRHTNVQPIGRTCFDVQVSSP